MFNSFSSLKAILEWLEFQSRVWSYSLLRAHTSLFCALISTCTRVYVSCKAGASACEVEIVPLSGTKHSLQIQATLVTLLVGWTKEEVDILRDAIMKFGVGRWKQITDSNCLPGKTPAQLNLQTQRMLGQQSLSVLNGIHLDPQEVWKDNQQITAVKRKNGFIVRSGKKLGAEEKRLKLEENTKKYGLPKEKIDAIELPDRSREILKLKVLTKEAKTRRVEYLKERLVKLEARKTSLTLLRSPAKPKPSDRAGSAATAGDGLPGPSNGKAATGAGTHPLGRTDGDATFEDEGLQPMAVEPVMVDLTVDSESGRDDDQYASDAILAEALAPSSDASLDAWEKDDKDDFDYVPPSFSKKRRKAG